MQAEFKTAQLRVRKNCIIAEGSAGTIFYASPTRARVLIDAGAAELVNVGPVERPVVGPSETPAAGPSEFKEPAEKKYSAAALAGPLTASASSTGSGTAEQPSSSAAALVSPQRTSKPSKRRGRPRKGG